jgi:endonuclease YncB( thermonuclease family)
VDDGDTIKVRLLPSGEKQTVRIQGIDCPESHVNAKCKRGPKEGRHDCAWQVPRGLKASKRAAELMKQKTVYLECAGKCTKVRYGRDLRYVRLEDGRDFGLIMIKEGLCEDYGWKYPHPRGGEYKKVQVDARLAGKGIWESGELPPLFIGKGLAESLRLKKGDVVWMIRPPTDREAQLFPEAWFRVAGIFETGKLELDTKRVCATPEGVEIKKRDKEVEILEGIISSQHNMAGIEVLVMDEGKINIESCKKALGVP